MVLDLDPAQDLIKDLVVLSQEASSLPISIWALSLLPRRWLDHIATWDRHQASSGEHLRLPASPFRVCRLQEWVVASKAAADLPKVLRTVSMAACLPRARSDATSRGNSFGPTQMRRTRMDGWMVVSL